MRTWHDKAQERIKELCHAAWLKANTNKAGKRYKRHRDYSVPLEAELLIECLNRNDEYGAKQIFLYGIPYPSGI